MIAKLRLYRILVNPKAYRCWTDICRIVVTIDLDLKEGLAMISVEDRLKSWTLWSMVNVIEDSEMTHAGRHSGEKKWKVSCCF